MARKIKREKRKSTAVATKTVTRRIYVKAKRAGRKIRRAATQPVSKKDIILAVAGAGVGGIGGAIVLSKIPGPDMVKNGATAAIGGVVTYMGLKKKNKLLMGAGLGMAAVGVQGILAGFIPSATSEMMGAPYYYAQRPQIAAPVHGYEPLSAPFAGNYEPLSAPFDGDDTTI